MIRVPLEYITEPGWWLISLSPAAWKAEIKRITVLGQPKQKLGRPPSQPVNQMLWNKPGFQ
jgi:hypothetical protein